MKPGLEQEINTSLYLKRIFTNGLHLIPLRSKNTNLRHTRAKKKNTSFIAHHSLLGFFFVNSSLLGHGNGEERLGAPGSPAPAAAAVVAVVPGPGPAAVPLLPLLVEEGLVDGAQLGVEVARGGGRGLVAPGKTEAARAGARSEKVNRGLI